MGETEQQREKEKPKDDPEMGNTSEQKGGQKRRRGGLKGGLKCGLSRGLVGCIGGTMMRFKGVLNYCVGDENRVSTVRIDVLTGCFM